MRRKIQPPKFLSNEFLTNTSAVNPIIPQSSFMQGLAVGVVQLQPQDLLNAKRPRPQALLGLPLGFRVYRVTFRAYSA